MTVTVNDLEVTIADGTTLADLIASRNLPSTGIAAALNGKLVPAVRRGETILSDGDKIVIIKAFYGG